MAPSLIAFEAWSQANAAATAAEKKVHQAAIDFAYGRSGPPSEAMLEDAFVKRLAATQAFEDVLREQARLAAEIRSTKAEESRGGLRDAGTPAQDSGSGAAAAQ